MGQGKIQLISHRDGSRGPLLPVLSLVSVWGLAEVGLAPGLGRALAFVLHKNNNFWFVLKVNRNLKGGTGTSRQANTTFLHVRDLY